LLACGQVARQAPVDQAKRVLALERRQFDDCGVPWFVKRGFEWRVFNFRRILQVVEASNTQSADEGSFRTKRRDGKKHVFIRTPFLGKEKIILSKLNKKT
jgi:hypothetical protein